MAEAIDGNRPIERRVDRAAGVGQQTPPEHNPARLDRFRRQEGEDELGEHRLGGLNGEVVNWCGAAGSRCTRLRSENSLEATRKSPPFPGPRQLRLPQRHCTVAGLLDTAGNLVVEPGSAEPCGSAQEEPAQTRPEVRADARRGSQGRGLRHVSIVERSA